MYTAEYCLEISYCNILQLYCDIYCYIFKRNKSDLFLLSMKIYGPRQPHTCTCTAAITWLHTSLVFWRCGPRLKYWKNLWIYWSLASCKSTSSEVHLDFTTIKQFNHFNIINWWFEHVPWGFTAFIRHNRYIRRRKDVFVSLRDVPVF